MSNSYVHSIFTLLLIKSFFEKNKSLRAASESMMYFGLELPLKIVYHTKSTWFMCPATSMSRNICKYFVITGKQWLKLNFQLSLKI